MISVICMQLNSYKYSYKTLTILFDINHLFVYNQMVSIISIQHN